MNLGENLTDIVLIASTGVASIGTGIHDISTGGNITEEMWKNCMSYIATEQVNNAFTDFYKNNEIGKWLDKNAVEALKSYGIGSQVSEGLGYTAGLVLLTILTGGAAGVATGSAGTAVSVISNPLTISALATAAGTGKNTQDYWARARDNANGEEWRTLNTGLGGIGYGLANGLWEGLQYYTGAKIATINPFTSAVSNAAARVGLDTAFNSLDTAARATTTVVADYIAKGTPITSKNWNKAFDEQGGMDAVTANILIGLMASLGGEVIDIGKTRKKVDLEVSEINKKSNVENIFKDTRSSLGGFGNDQGVFTGLRKKDPELYNYMKNILTDKYGFSKVDADKYMNIVDKVGACNYARCVNSVLEAFAGKSEEFEKVFGFPMYITRSNGEITLNDAELLADLYYWGNTFSDDAELIGVNNGRSYLKNDRYMIEFSQTNPNDDRIIAIKPGESFTKREGYSYVEIVPQRGGGYDDLNSYIQFKNKSDISVELISIKDDFKGVVGFNEKKQIITDLINRGENLSLGGARISYKKFRW